MHEEMPANDSNVLGVGVARTLITPPVGIPLCGALRDAPSQRVERDLTVTALTLSTNETRTVLIGCDLIMFRPEEARTLRERIAAEVGIPVHGIVINTSHTHATPSPPGYREYDPDADRELVDLVDRYYDEVSDQIVGAVHSALEESRPARYGFGLGSTTIGVNRREQLPDGTMVLGENADGVVDPTVGVVRFDDLAGRPLAMVLHYTCHPDILGPKCDLISPDYVGATRDAAEQLTGVPMLFLQGAAGDIDPACGIVNGADGVEEMNRAGVQLGCEAVRVYQTINTLRERHQRVSWKSMDSVVTGWDYADRRVNNGPVLKVKSRHLRMPLRPLPGRDEAEHALAEAEATLRDVLERRHDLSERLVARRRVEWARRQLEAVVANDPSELDFEIVGIRLDDFALIVMPVEPFVEIGLGIRGGSPFRYTFVSGYSNGLYFYVPTKAAFDQGGYEVNSYRTFLQAAGPTAEWADILEREGHRLLKALEE